MYITNSTINVQYLQLILHVIKKKAGEKPSGISSELRGDISSPQDPTSVNQDRSTYRDQYRDTREYTIGGERLGVGFSTILHCGSCLGFCLSRLAGLITFKIDGCDISWII